jgi:O-antigen ligase
MKRGLPHALATIGDIQFVLATGLVLLAVLVIGPAADDVVIAGHGAAGPLALSLPRRTVELSPDEAGAWRYDWDTALEQPGPTLLRVSDPTESATLRVSIGPLRDQLVIAIDSPSPGQTISGAVQIRGWAVDRDSAASPGIKRIALFFDDSRGEDRATNISLGERRDDVASSFGQSFAASGWTAQLDSTGVSSGSHRIIAVAWSDTGNQAEATVGVRIQSRSTSAELPSPAQSLVFDSPLSAASVWGTPLVRAIGLVQLVALITVMCAIATTSALTRHRLTQAFVLAGALVGLLAFAFVDRHTIRPWIPQALLNLLPSLDDAVRTTGSALLGVRGSIPASSIAFQIAPAAVAAAFFSYRAGNSRGRAAWLVVLSAAILMLLASGARVPAFAAGIGLIVLFWPERYRRALPAFVAASLILPVLLVLAGVNDSDQSRIPIWTNALGLAASKPFGLGFGVYGQQDLTVHHAHSAYLQTLLDTGPLGLGAVIALLVVSIRRAWSERRSGASPYQLGSLPLALLVTLLITATTDSVLMSPVPRSTYMVTVMWPGAFLILAIPLRKVIQSA